MDAVVIEPSPLARNVFRLLWQHTAPQGRLVAVAQVADLARISADDVEQPTVIVGGQALLSEFGLRDWRRWLMDAPVWRDAAKVVVFLDRDREALAPMRELAHTQWLKRPFRVEQFVRWVGGADGASA